MNADNSINEPVLPMARKRLQSAAAILVQALLLGGDRTIMKTRKNLDLILPFILLLKQYAQLNKIL